MILNIHNKLKNITKDKVMNSKKNGFTLIELVAVLAIVLLLSAALAPKVSGYVNNAKKVAALNEAKTYLTAYESVSHKIGTSESDTSIDDLLAYEDGKLDLPDNNKLSNDFTIAQCRLILDTEKNDFEFDEKGQVKL